MGRKGYVYTILTISLVILSLSLVSFYFQVSRTKIEDSLTRMSLEELHYFVDGMKKDYSRALEISGRRAATYAINYILNSSHEFSGYEMVPCNNFQYSLNGSQAAISELMICGTLFGGKIEEMENNTLLNWTQRIKEEFKENKGFINLKKLDIKNITLVLYDPWNFAVISIIAVSASDKENLTQFNENLSVSSLVSILGLEDPLYYIKTNESDLIRKFEMCNETGTYGEINGSVIDEWISSECYHGSNLSYNGSSFFDRLDGSLNLTEKYAEQSKEYFGFSAKENIGLESFLNAYELFLHNKTEYWENYTWVDYLFWQNVIGDCTVNYTTQYRRNETEDITFWIDQEHKEKYNISGANCPT